VIVEHVHEWIRFTKYCVIVALMFHSHYAQDVGDYIRWRFPKETRALSVHKASLRIFMKAELWVLLQTYSRITAPTSALFQDGSSLFGLSASAPRSIRKTLRKNTFALSEFAEFISRINIQNLRDLTATIFTISAFIVAIARQ